MPSIGWLNRSIILNYYADGANLSNEESTKPTREPYSTEERFGTTQYLSDTDFEENDPRWGNARFSSRMVLQLKVLEYGNTFNFDYDSVQELLIGRRDPTNNSQPDVDLEPFDAVDKGVSRRHASIIRKDGALSIVDHGTPNGTFLNGQKLVPQQSRIVRDGDDLRFGHLTLRISFLMVNG